MTKKTIAKNVAAYLGMWAFIAVMVLLPFTTAYLSGYVTEWMTGGAKFDDLVESQRAMRVVIGGVSFLLPGAFSICVLMLAFDRDYRKKVIKNLPFEDEPEPQDPEPQNWR